VVQARRATTRVPGRCARRVACPEHEVETDGACRCQEGYDRPAAGQACEKIVTGGLGAPCKAVAKVPGAVAYVRASYARELRPLRVDGVLPGKPGYRVVFAE